MAASSTDRSGLGGVARLVLAITNLRDQYDDHGGDAQNGEDTRESPSRDPKGRRRPE